jgi:hypothetical protein
MRLLANRLGFVLVNVLNIIQSTDHVRIYS